MSDAAKQVMGNLRAALAAAQEENRALLDLAERAKHKAKVMSEIADGKQATIDRLMLEYCPDEMTPEQLDEWGRNQVKVGEP